jgi:hypothetical protein
MDDPAAAAPPPPPPPSTPQQQLPFPLARTWGKEAPPPAQHVLLAEFDIDRGW